MNNLLTKGEFDIMKSGKPPARHDYASAIDMLCKSVEILTEALRTIRDKDDTASAKAYIAKKELKEVWGPEKE